MKSAIMDCSSTDVLAECSLLMNSSVMFIPYPQQRRLQLTIFNQLHLPLNLTLQGGECEINCEGGEPENCPTMKQFYFSQKVGSPISFENCSSHLHYCVIAQIGECCSVCTDTQYMADYQTRTFSAPTSLWNAAALLLVSLVILTVLLAVINFLFTKGEKTPKSVRASSIIHVPLQSKHMESKADQVTVLCLYVNDGNQQLLSGIQALQLFLSEKGFNVVDIYREEEIIDQSIYKWAQAYLRDCNTKVLLVDTAALRSLLDCETGLSRARTQTEQAIVYIHSCIPLRDLFTQLFVVRFQETILSEGRFLELSGGRCYMYPINSERLAEDLLTLDLDEEEHMKII